MLNIAVIGLGWWGQMHLRSTHEKSDKVAITAIVDLDPDLAQRTSNEFGIPVADSYDAVLADPAIDAAILVTPHSLHTDQIVAGAAAGMHIFTEKPFALNKADAERAVAAAEGAGIQLGLGHNQRYAAAQTRIKEMIDAGELGEIMHMEGNLSHDTLAEVKSWRHSADEAPGGGLWHMGSHYIDLFQHFAGPIQEVYAQVADRVIERDSAQALLTFESGATGYVGNVMVTAQTRMLNVLGSKGWVKATGPNTILVGMRGGEPATVELDPVDPVRANVEGFADAIAGRAAYRFTNQDMIRDVVALDAVATSLKSGRRERVA
ncbi:MAG: Gfo/Idh/MocA family oxidoreductase [Alphaproteobacteria bacterium]|nr:Gfo/Idh/MocA family oxidoreductase [Alphaproteobacteria bacterium]